MENGNSTDSKLGDNDSSKTKSIWDIRPYLPVAISAILVIFVCIIIFFAVFRFDGLVSGVGAIFTMIQPIIFGLIIAYLLNPIMMFFERIYNKRLFRDNPQKNLKQKQIIRGLAVTCAVIVFLAVIAVLLWLIVPRLVTSVQDLVSSMNEKVEAFNTWTDRFFKQDTKISQQFDTISEKIFDYAKQWLQKQLLNQSDIITSVTTGVYTVVKLVFNTIVGLIISVYVLTKKEVFVGQFKKIIYGIFRPRFGNIIMEVVSKADRVFGGFFIGIIIDSLIVGCITMVGLSIMHIPYAILIGMIVGVTNVIPFFGPYIGAIPSLILIIMVNPIQGIYFLIFILILQQFDGNIMAPKIQGETTGLSPFWVIFAVLFFGGIFGIPGMLFGVPVFAVIYYIIKRLIEHFLRKKKLPAETSAYVQLEKIDVGTNMIKNEPYFRKSRIVILPENGKNEKNKKDKSEREK